jgi:lipopolysaccharide biosynthesis glycosyltransferase
MKQVPISVAFAADENYVQHMAVTMLSLLHTRKVAFPVHFTVIGDDLSEKSVSALTEIAQSNNASISFPVVDFDVFGDLNVNYHFSRAMYGRLLLPDIIDAIKVLYLDCDILIKADISDLWKIDISEYYAGAVIDPCLSGMGGYYIFPPGGRIISSCKPYFNSGVLLLNLEKCRQDNLMDQALRFVDENSERLDFPDQDALNVVMQGKWLPLDPCWNVQSAIFDMCYNEKHRGKLLQDFIKAVKNPAIVHYTEAVKPWHYECLLPYVEEYYNYLAMTPWYGFKRPNSPNWDSFLRKHRRKFKRRLKSMFLGYRI